MESDLRIRRVSGDAPAVHGYYDLCPESLDGRRVVYFEFAGKVPGPGSVVVARPDGSERRTVAEAVPGGAHTGALQQWADADTVVFNHRGDGGDTTVLICTSDGSRRELPGSARMVSPDGRWALSHPPADRRSVALTGLQGGPRRELFTAEQALALHPGRDRVEKPEVLRFQNTKWSPDGASFLAVFTNEGYRRSHPELPRVKSILVAEADGANLRYLKEFGHHPMWSPDGSFVYCFDRLPNGGQSLVAQPADGGNPREIWPESPGVHATLTRDGSRVVADAFNWPARGRGGILLYNVASGDCRPLARFAMPDTTHETGCHPHPVWSRDQRRVYFNAAEDGTPHLYAIDL